MYAGTSKLVGAENVPSPVPRRPPRANSEGTLLFSQAWGTIGEGSGSFFHKKPRLVMKLMKNHPFSRRRFSKLLAGAPFVLRAQDGSLHARIKLDSERVIDDIDPKIYGNFVEHLGRCIEGGVFDETSPLSDANGYRRTCLKPPKTRSLNPIASATSTSPSHRPVE